VDLERYGERAQGMDITPWGVRSPGTLRDSVKGTLEMGLLFLWEIC
jgi:DNA polymerase III psi subunit